MPKAPLPLNTLSTVDSRLAIRDCRLSVLRLPVSIRLGLVLVPAVGTTDESACPPTSLSSGRFERSSEHEPAVRPITAVCRRSSSTPCGGPRVWRRGPWRLEATLRRARARGLHVATSRGVGDRAELVRVAALRAREAGRFDPGPMERGARRGRTRERFRGPLDAAAGHPAARRRRRSPVARRKVEAQELGGAHLQSARRPRSKVAKSSTK